MRIANDVIDGARTRTLIGRETRPGHIVKVILRTDIIGTGITIAHHLRGMIGIAIMTGTDIIVVVNDRGTRIMTKMVPGGGRNGRGTICPAISLRRRN